MMDLLAATKNKGKIKEIDRLIKEGPPEVNVYSLDDFNIFADCPETGDTFLDNSIEKSLFYSRMVTGIYTAADDSGLAVDAWEANPGSVRPGMPVNPKTMRKTFKSCCAS